MDTHTHTYIYSSSFDVDDCVTCVWGGCWVHGIYVYFLLFMDVFSLLYVDGSYGYVYNVLVYTWLLYGYVHV